MKTLVIYQDKVAHQDILDWAKKKNIDIDEEKTSWTLKHGEEEIIIIPKSLLIYFEQCDKLVLIGSFIKKELILILHYITIQSKEKL